MKGWQTKKLGDVAKAIYGYTESASYNEIGPKFLRITDIQDESVNWETVPFCKIGNADLEKYTLIDGDIVFARTGATTGKSFLVRSPPPSVFASYLIKVHITDKNLTPEYLYMFFQTKTYWDTINSGVSGSAQGGFNATKLSELNIPLPPLPEQRRIVAILDKAFAAIAKGRENAEKNLANARELFESYLQGVFANPGDGWEEKRLGEIIELLTDYHANGSYQVLKANVELKESEDYAWMVRSTDFENNFKNDKRYISKKAYDFLNKSRIIGNEIIISKIGNVGKVYLMPNINRPCSLAMNLFLIRIDEKKCLSKYIFRYLNSKNGQKQIETRVFGTTTKTITKENVRSIKIPVPPLKAQHRITTTLNAISTETKKLEAIYQQKIADFDELKKSILDKAFKGEL